MPDLTTSGYNEQQYNKKAAGGFASDSDEYLNAQQLPMIKGGGSMHAQNVADAYILNSTNQGVGIMGPGASFGAKGMKKNVQNPNFN